MAQFTNERSLGAEAGSGRGRRDGETVRSIDLPALEGENETVIDRCPKGLVAEERTAFGRNLLAEINRACERHAGHALPALVAWLIPRREELPARVRELVQGFMAEVGAASDSLLGARLARAFGVVYAAGILGVEAGVFPWPEARVLWAVRRCFRAARAELRDDALLAREGVSRFWGEVERARVPWPGRDAAPDADVAGAEVFRRKRRMDAEYAVVPTFFERVLPDRRQRELALAALQRTGRTGRASRGCSGHTTGPATTSSAGP